MSSGKGNYTTKSFQNLQKKRSSISLQMYIHVYNNSIALITKPRQLIFELTELRPSHEFVLSVFNKLLETETKSWSTTTLVLKLPVRIDKLIQDADIDICIWWSEIPSSCLLYANQGIQCSDSIPQCGRRQTLIGQVCQLTNETVAKIYCKVLWCYKSCLYTPHKHQPGHRECLAWTGIQQNINFLEFLFAQLISYISQQISHWLKLVYNLWKKGKLTLPSWIHEVCSPSQVGGLPLHVEFGWHTRVENPTRRNPTLQLKLAREPTLLLSTAILPLRGGFRVSHANAITSNVAI